LKTLKTAQFIFENRPRLRIVIIRPKLVPDAAPLNFSKILSFFQFVRFLKISFSSVDACLTFPGAFAHQFGEVCFCRKRPDEKVCMMPEWGFKRKKRCAKLFLSDFDGSN